MGYRGQQQITRRNQSISKKDLKKNLIIKNYTTFFDFGIAIVRVLEYNIYFRDGVRLDDALIFTRAKGDNAIKRTMEKLPSYIKYIEREYDLEILRKTAKKNAKHLKRAA